MLHPLLLRVLPSDLVLQYNRKIIFDASENSERGGSTTDTGSETAAFEAVSAQKKVSPVLSPLSEN